MSSLLIGLGAILTGVAALIQAFRSRSLRSDLRAVKWQVTGSNGVPTAQILEQLVEDLREDRQNLFRHVADTTRHT